MAFQLPELPNLPGVSDLNLDKLNPANCGTNIDLTALDDIQDAIKDALAEGKGALGDLESKFAEAQTKLEEGLTKLEDAIDEATSSLQDEIGELQAKFGEDFAAAKAEIQEKWGDVVDDIEGTLAKIPSLNDLLAGADSIDLCKEIENVEQKVVENKDEITGKITQSIEVIKKAQAPQMPNINSTEPEKFEETKTEVQKENSKASPATDLDRYTVDNDYYVMRSGTHQALKTYWELQVKKINEENDTLKADPLYAKIKKMMKDLGKRGSELQDEGLLTEEEVAFRYRVVNQKKLAKAFKERQQKFEGIVFVHEQYIGGQTDEKQYNKIYDYWSTHPTTLPGDVTRFNDVHKQRHINEAETIKKYYRYNNLV